MSLLIIFHWPELSTWQPVTAKQTGKCSLSVQEGNNTGPVNRVTSALAKNIRKCCKTEVGSRVLKAGKESYESAGAADN